MAKCARSDTADSLQRLREDTAVYYAKQSSLEAPIQMAKTVRGVLFLIFIRHPSLSSRLRVPMQTMDPSGRTLRN